jgi:hypothetical protein
MARLLLTALLALLALPAFAAPAKLPKGPCWDAAGAFHKVDPWLLYSIAYVESGHDVSVVNANRNGTIDRGLMQINSVHYPALRAHGFDPALVVSNACMSTYAGAWVLRDAMSRYGYTWEAIAAYNVGSLNNPARRAIGYAYAKRVEKAYALLTKRAGRAVRP